MNENIEPYRKLTINNEGTNHEQFHWVRSEDIRQGTVGVTCYGKLTVTVYR